jgi:hypothetical protein
MILVKNQYEIKCEYDEPVGLVRYSREATVYGSRSFEIMVSLDHSQ